MTENILVTGASGFLGSKLVEKLFEDENVNVRGIARNEGKLIELKEKFPRLELLTGDISNKCMVEKAMKGITKVFHLAAFKHIGLAEKNVLQCVNSNVLGTIHILEESFRVRPSLVMGISTDKAAQISGVYGASKFLMERLFLEAEQINTDTKYRIVRYGNVLYSTGSVLCKWRERMKRGEKVIITDLDATRFFWTVEQAVEHIFECIAKSKDTMPFIPKMKSMRIGDLLEAMMRKYGEVEVETIGLQPGENKHETVDGKTYSNEVEKFSIEEIMSLI